MADYTGGYTGAIDSQARRGYENASTQWLLQALAQAQQKQQMEAQQRQQQMRDQATAGAGLQQMSAPPQSPPPGEASVPMQQPQGPPPMPPGAPQGMPPAGPPMGMGAPQQAMPGGAQPPVPAGWRPSPSAPTTLGGPGGPPPEASPQGPMGPPPGGPPGGGHQMIPGQMMSVQSAIQALSKANVPPERMIPVLEQMMPAISAQNKQTLDSFKAETAAQKAAIDAYKATIASMRAETQAVDVESKVARRESGSAQKDRELDIKERKGVVRGAGGGGTGGSETLSPGGLKVAAELIKAGRPLPGGWSKAGQSRGNAILNQMALDEEGGAGSGAVAGGMADYRANSTAYTAISKDIAAIEPYNEMLHKNAGILKTLAGRVAKTDSALANKPINWLQKNVTGNADVGEFLAQMQIVQTEAARVLNNPRLVGQLTDSARHEMQGVVNGDMPLQMTNRILDRLMSDGDNRVTAMRKKAAELKGALRVGGGTSAATAGLQAPEVGTVKQGYRFKGGDPAQRENWERVQ